MAKQCEPHEKAMKAALGALTYAFLLRHEFIGATRTNKTCIEIAASMRDLRQRCLLAHILTDDLTKVRAVCDSTCAFDEAYSKATSVLWSITHILDVDQTATLEWLKSRAGAFPLVPIEPLGVWKHWNSLQKAVLREPVGPKQIEHLINRMGVNGAKVATRPRYSVVRTARFWRDKYDISQDTLAKRIKAGAIRVSKTSTNRLIEILEADWPPDYTE